MAALHDTGHSVGSRAGTSGWNCWRDQHRAVQRILVDGAGDIRFIGCEPSSPLGVIPFGLCSHRHLAVSDWYTVLRVYMLTTAR